MAGKQFRLVVFIGLFLGLITGCGDPTQENIEKTIPTVQQKLDVLAKLLNENRVRNASILKEYAKIVSEARPELATLATNLAKDGTVSGTPYTSLVSRFDDAKSRPEMFADPQERLYELQNIREAANIDSFGDMLSDPINVLADMSNGTLARVNAISKAQSLSANGANDYGAGSQLIGNPNYGQWQTSSNGMSFWEWYGMYSLFNNIFGGYNRPIYYDNWYRKRDYSYYQDYGRSRYTKPSKYKTQLKAEKRLSNKFSKTGGYKSSYAKARVGGSKMSAKSTQNAKFLSQSKSNFSRSGGFSQRSSYSSNSSFRNSRSSTSRGASRGK